MAIHRGVQSMVFWYASCAPCAERRYKKQRAKEMEQARIDRELLASQIPNFYRHPGPTDTNPHWQYEIDIGPVLVGRRWKGYSEDPRKKTSSKARSNGSNPGSPDLRPAIESRDGMNDSKLDFKKYQRDDDELWGNTSTERLGFPRSWQSDSSVTVPPRALTRGSDGSSRYSSSRNPPLNELHPPTVTKMNSRDDTRWIFQPLPTADVMLGKAKAPRSRSGTGTSSRISAKSPVLLSQDIGHELKSGGAGSLTSTISRESSGLNADGVKRLGNDRPQIAETDFAAEQAEVVPSQQSTSGAVGTSEGSTNTTTTQLHSPQILNTKPETLQQPRNLSSHPRLSTIPSNFPPSTDFSKLENGRPLSSSNTPNEKPRLSALISKDDSLRVLQELAPSSRIFKSKVISPDELVVRASKKTGVRMPSQDRGGMGGEVEDPELFEQWDTADFELPEWIHEHTKREVKERWSMDI